MGIIFHMNSKLTLGQYYSSDSLIHRLDPRLKIRWTLCLLILLFIGRSVPLFSFYTIIAFGMLVLSGIPLTHVVRGTGKIMLIMCLLNLINLFTVYGKVIVKLGPVTVTQEGLLRYLMLLWRFVLLIFAEESEHTYGREDRLVETITLDEVARYDIHHPARNVLSTRIVHRVVHAAHADTTCD